MLRYRIGNYYHGRWIRKLRRRFDGPSVSILRVLRHNSITLSGRTLSYPYDESTAEAKALKWLIDDDLGTSGTNRLKVRQQFVLAMLRFQNGPFDNEHTSTWLSSVEGCDWESIAACVDGEVTSIWLDYDGLTS